MSNATISRLGASDFGADKEALFLKQFGGEVLVAYAETDTFTDKHTVRSISSGKSAQFPVMWKAGASYHTPGSEILGGEIRHGERIITIDKVLIAPAAIAEIDEAMNHYDVRAPYSTEIGRALGNKFSRNVACVSVLAARASGVVTGEPGGTALTDLNIGSDVSVLRGAFFDAAQAFDEKDVPEVDRYAYLKPAQYYLLAQDTTVLNKDWNGSGSYSDGKVYKVADITLVKSNQVPTTDLSADQTISPSAQGNFATTVGVIVQKEAVGTVKLLNMKLEGEWDMRRQVTMMLGKYAVGHGVLRPSCAVELKTA